MSQLPLFSDQPCPSRLTLVTANPANEPQPETPIRYTFRSVCPVCGRGAKFYNDRLVMSVEQMKENGWIESAPNVWDFNSEPCSRNCGRIANGEKVRRK